MSGLSTPRSKLSGVGGAGLVFGGYGKDLHGNLFRFLLKLGAVRLSDGNGRWGTIDYISMATQGNGASFGNLSTNRSKVK